MLRNGEQNLFLLFALKIIYLISDKKHTKKGTFLLTHVDICDVLVN